LFEERCVSPSHSHIRDNRERGSVGQFLQQKIRNGSRLSVVSAYFTIYAFEALKDKLGGIEGLDFLFGEPRFVRAIDPEKTDKKSFKIEDEGLSIQNRLQQRQAARDCADWIRSKVRIKSIRQANLLHGKMYHIANGEVQDAILGSSNFTVGGLGLGQNQNNNIELNLEIDSRDDLYDLKAWFDELWADDDLVEDVHDEVLAYLDQLYANHAPQFVYYKTLYHLFERFLAEQARGDLLNERSQLIDSEIWRALFEFQKDGVKGAINKLLTHNGCVIADSVGLGKTFEALAVIKYFELLNARVLVLCPKKLRENWTVYQAQNNSELNPFLKDRFGYTVLSHTDLSREHGYVGDINLETLNWGNYDLILIDESHNFRNNTPGKRDEDGNIVRKSRYERLIEDVIKGGIKTKVLLLSATPVNNDLSDLYSQLSLITEGRDDAFRESLGLVNIKQTLINAQKDFNAWSEDGSRDTTRLLEQLSSALFTLLDELTIARSRAHIQRYYSATIDALGGFPERLKPLSRFPEVDRDGLFMSYERLNRELLDYKLSLFNPSKYVLPEYRARYETDRVRNFSQSLREHFLIGMMKVNFLKRLESSVHSFALTMERTIAKIVELETRITQFEQSRASGALLDQGELVVEDVDDEELQQAMLVGQKLTFNLAHLDLAAWRSDLQQDKRQLNGLRLQAKDVSAARDAKLAELQQLIQQKVIQPTTTRQGQPNRKVLVFTAFADTAIYLYDALRDWATTTLGIHIALVTGTGANKTSFGSSEYSHILTNFAPRAKQRAKMKQMPQDAEIDLLIATDCISEGQNLQDCDYLVNYDIHWNPVRIIQRFGRIDRIGSPNTQIQLVNFWPMPNLDAYINLKSRVESRMALVDITATSGDNLLATQNLDLSAEQLEALAADELSYRDRQLLRLKDEVLDLEDFSESVTLSEFTLDDFRIELAKYIESNRRLLEDAPLGLYAVVPPHPDYEVIQPGVIFCLRQKGNTAGNEQINPLQPFFLIYVRDDGEVRYSFAQPKQILEMFRLLCAEQTTPYQALCDLFDTRTNNGANMAAQSALLEKAVASIAGTFSRRAMAGLRASRSGQLPERAKQVTSTTDFDLITWLVILDMQP
jgi:hypothetical protein